MDVSADILRSLAGAQIRETQILITELCGVFWIAAELLILFFVVEARRHLGRDPIPANPVWDRVSTRRAVYFLVLAVGALLVVVMRPVIWETLSWCLQHGALDVQSAALEDFHAVQRHLAVWAAFVTAWVVLEGAIVYHGYRAYRVFRGRVSALATGPLNSRKAPRAMLVLLLLLGALAAAGGLVLPAFAAQSGGGAAPQAGDYWSQVVRMSEDWLSPYRNALYLYLRVAGVVWIGVEWVAAVVLWRTHVLVGRVLRSRRGLS